MAKRSKADVKHGIDLLWSHQIRRENAALHKEVKVLQQQLFSQADEVKKLRVVCEKATATADTAIACIEKALADQTALQAAVDTANRQTQNTAEHVSNLQACLQEVSANQTQVITHFNKDIGQLRADFATFSEHHGDDLKETKASLEQALSKLTENPIELAIEELQQKVKQLEHSLVARHSHDSVSRVEESIEEPGEDIDPRGKYSPFTLSQL